MSLSAHVGKSGKAMKMSRVLARYSDVNHEVPIYEMPKKSMTAVVTDTAHQPACAPPLSSPCLH